MTSKRSIIVACGLALVVAACGGDDASDATAGGWDDRFDPTATTAASAGWDDGSGESTENTASAGQEPDATFEDPGVNDDRWTDEEALSTFALDVDTASYTVARRYLTEGRLPDPDSVRVEEYVNFFGQDYPVPSEGFSVTVDGAPTPFVGEDTRVLRIGLRAADVELRPPTNLVFVVDTSGSMAEGNRLEHVKQSLGMLTEALNDDDTVTIVEFGSDARLVLSPTLGVRTERIISAIESLEAGGSTNFEAGLALAYGAAEELQANGTATRVIVASDGVANVGLDDPESLVNMIRAAADRGVTLVTVGVGMDTYNDALLEQLANDGDGFYAYVDTRQEAEDLFVNDLTGTLVTVAEDARVQVEFDPDSVLEWRLIGYENRALDHASFRDDTVDAGEIGAGHTVTALYELRLTRAAERGDADRLGRVHLRWLDPETDDPTEVSRTIRLDDLSDGFGDTSPRFRQNVVVAQYAEVLRGSSHAGVWSMEDLVRYADEVADQLSGDEDVAEFAELVRMAARMGA